MKKVIILDDSSIQLNISKKAFEENSWKVYFIQNKQNIIEAIYDIMPDLIISDAILPRINDYKLLKNIKENEKISQIPIVIYSILPQETTQEYFKEYKITYFYSKNKTTINELVKQANIITKNKTREKIYLNQETHSEKNSQIQNPSKKTIPTKEIEALINKINTQQDDKEILTDFFNTLKIKINYNLAIVNLYDFNFKSSCAYFNIRNIILNPMFQREIIKNQRTQKTEFIKEYAPLSKTVSSLNDFSSSIILEIKNKDRLIAKMTLYSFEKIVLNNNLKESIKTLFTKRFIDKSNQEIKINNYSSNTQLEKITQKHKNKYKNSTYVATIKIANYNKLTSDLNIEDIDIFNIKVIQTIKNNLTDDEEIIKENDREYTLIIVADDYTLAFEKLKNISLAINYININNSNSILQIGITNCQIKNNFNISEAKKITLDSSKLIEIGNKK